MSASLPVGQLVFYNDPEDSWRQATLAAAFDEAKKKFKVKDKENNAEKEVDEIDVYPILNSAVLEENCDDLLMLSELAECTLLHSVRRRYLEDIVYTYIGAIVLALNPFNYNIPWYKDDFMPNYLAEGPVIQKNKPHSWSVAHNTYHEMLRDNQDQCILVSGESGAGKTEAVKIVIKYLKGLVRVRSGNDTERAQQEAISNRILQASPILEAFGNAKTDRNDNSSRFGKFLQVQFNGPGFIQGSEAINYLLEKSRVVRAAQKERIYHSFYQIVKGADAAKYHVNDVKSFPSVNSGGILDNASMEDAAGDDLSYRISNIAFKDTGFTSEQADAIWRILAGILWVLRVEFKAKGDECELAPKAEEAIKEACGQWKVDPATLQKELLTQTRVVSGETVVSPNNLTRAIDSRDALAKALYKHLFDFMFEIINAGTSGKATTANWIGLLDIFGFEDFGKANNSFEQLCINLANETLQNHYNDYVFTKDMEECKAEGIDVAAVTFIDNKCTCTLLDGKGGVLELLDEECALGKGSDLGFLGKIDEKFGARGAKHPSFEKKQLDKDAFIIKHFAGVVGYTVTDFLDKNRDTLKDAMKFMMRASTCPVVAGIIPEPVDVRGGSSATVSRVFRGQIKSLMDLINSTNPHWIRCIKPHKAKKPKMFSQTDVMAQMRSSGVLETVRIRKAGYPIRIKLAYFAGRFRIILNPQPSLQSEDEIRSACSAILAAAGFGPQDGQLGTTKVFLRAHAYSALEEVKRGALQSRAIVAQQHVRATLSELEARRREKAKFKDIIDAIEKAMGDRTALAEDALAGASAIQKAENAEFEALLAKYRKESEVVLVKVRAAEERRKKQEAELARLKAEKEAEAKRRKEEAEAKKLALERAKQRAIEREARAEALSRRLKEENEEREARRAAQHNRVMKARAGAALQQLQKAFSKQKAMEETVRDLNEQRERVAAQQKARDAAAARERLVLVSLKEEEEDARQSCRWEAYGAAKSRADTVEKRLKRANKLAEQAVEPVLIAAAAGDPLKSPPPGISARPAPVLRGVAELSHPSIQSPTGEHRASGRKGGVDGLGASGRSRGGGGGGLSNYSAGPSVGGAPLPGTVGSPGPSRASTMHSPRVVNADGHSTRGGGGGGASGDGVPPPASDGGFSEESRGGRPVQAGVLPARDFYKAVARVAAEEKWVARRDAAFEARTVAVGSQPAWRPGGAEPRSPPNSEHAKRLAAYQAAIARSSPGATTRALANQRGALSPFEMSYETQMKSRRL